MPVEKFKACSGKGFFCLSFKGNQEVVKFRSKYLEIYFPPKTMDETGQRYLVEDRAIVEDVETGVGLGLRV